MMTMMMTMMLMMLMMINPPIHTTPNTPSCFTKKTIMMMIIHIVLCSARLLLQLQQLQQQ